MPTLELVEKHLGTWKHHLVSTIGICGNYHHPLAQALMALVFGFEGPEAKSGQPSPGKCRPVFEGVFGKGISNSHTSMPKTCGLVSFSVGKGYGDMTFRCLLWIPEWLDSQGRASCWAMWVRKEELWCCVAYHVFKHASMIKLASYAQPRASCMDLIEEIYIP